MLTKKDIGLPISFFVGRLVSLIFIFYLQSHILSVKFMDLREIKRYKRGIAIDENIVKVYTEFITCFVFLGKIYKSDQFQGRENKDMKNMKVRTS